MRYRYTCKGWVLGCVDFRERAGTGCVWGWSSRFLSTSTDLDLMVAVAVFAIWFGINHLSVFALIQKKKKKLWWVARLYSWVEEFLLWKHRGQGWLVLCVMHKNVLQCYLDERIGQRTNLLLIFALIWKFKFSTINKGSNLIFKVLNCILKWKCL